jgi:hypothetical protein
MQTLGVETANDLRYGLLADIHQEILTPVQQVAAEFHIKPIWLADVEEVLRIIAIQT